MERIRGGDDHGVLGELRELVDAGQPLGMAAGEVRIALDHLRAAIPTPLRLRLPEVPEADERVVVAPFRRDPSMPGPWMPQNGQDDGILAR